MTDIHHAPAGRGHAYRPSLAQRVPVTPADAETVAVGVVTPPDIDEVVVEVAIDGQRLELPMQRQPLVEAEGDAAGEDGHLAAAAAAGEDLGDRVAWRVGLGAHSAGTTVRYRFTAAGASTDWWSFTVAGWSSTGGSLTVDGDADRLDRDSVEWLVADGDARRVRFALRLDDGEHVVGLGERFHALDQRGWAVDTVVFEQYKHQHTRTYLPVPFALVVGAGAPWGFHVDTSRRCWFDVGASREDRIVVEVACDPDDPTATLRLFSGDRPEEVLDAFWDGAGRPADVPDWVFRPWMSANEWNTQERVEREVGRTLAEGIPAGVIVLEAWSDEATFTIWRDAQYEPHPDGSPHRLEDFTFPADGAWPDPAGMIRWLHDHDVRVLLWQIPVLATDRPPNEQLDHDRRVLAERGLAVREEDGSPYRNRGWWFPGAMLPDFTSEEATRWWIDKRRYLLEDLGVDGFKTDGGEHAWGDELRYADGTRGDESNNLFANAYAAAYHRLLDETGTEGVTFSRAGWTGAGTTPCHWAGDEDSTWEAYRAAITAGQTAGVSGVVHWGWDHGGFSGEIPDAELYLRTAAQACFSPIMQYHAEYNDHRTPSNDRTPWNIAERTGEPQVLDVYRRLAVLRDRLAPHLADQARAGVARGLPLMRALCLEWPDDPVVWEHPCQYLLGDDLLVAPVTEPGVDRWGIYVPGDTWVDPWTSEVHTGPALVEVDAPLDRIPVLVRRSAAEAVLPLFQELP